MQEELAVLIICSLMCMQKSQHTRMGFTKSYPEVSVLYEDENVTNVMKQSIEGFPQEEQTMLRCKQNN